jgi:hypothetical protein
MDKSSVIILSAFKLLHISVAWIAIFIADKMFQMYFVQKMYLDDTVNRAQRPAPDLQYFVLLVLLINFLTMAMLFVLMIAVSQFLNRDGTVGTFDSLLLRLMLFDYIVSVLSATLIGVMTAAAVQNNKKLEFRDMGLRGIRAFADIFLMCTIVMVAVPFYRMVRQDGGTAPSKRFFGVQR